jgi:hypothetical protein
MPFHVSTTFLAVVCVLVAVSGFNTAAASAEVQQTFHVSLGGSDDNPGTKAEPFASIEKARDAVRQINGNMTGDIVVVLKGGTYNLSETVRFDAQDSGTGGHNVIYKAREGEEVTLSGGKVITGWQSDVDGRWKVPCGEHFRQLYIDDKRAVRAMSSEVKIEKKVHWYDTSVADVPGMELFGENGYRTTDVAMADWRNPGDIEFCYYVAWCHTRCKVESIVRDGSHAVVRMVQPQFMLARCKGGAQVKLPNYVENALELLDEPGEWYLDRSDKMLYYKPLPGEKMDEVEAVAPLLEKLVVFHGLLDKPVGHIQFHGITFAHATWLRPSRIGLVDVQATFVQHTLNRIDRPGLDHPDTVNNAHNEDLKSPANIVCRTGKHIRFERCTFAHLGGAGLDLEYGSSDNVVSGCRFHDISGTAIQVGGIERSDHHPGDKRTTVRNNHILNNLIENCAVEYRGGLGVFVGYTDATVIAHNEIRNMPYSGVSVGWGWGEEDAGGGQADYYQPYLYNTPSAARNNRIEYNHIHRVMKLQQDGSGIYTLGNMAGTIIRGNHIHDNRGIPGGVYLDQGSGFIEVTGNVIYNVFRPMNYNNKAQNRIATCKEHDNWFVDKGDKLEIDLEIRQVIDSAGLTSEYRDLLRD